VADITTEPKVRGVDFEAKRFVIHLDDGRSLAVPLEWYPQLRDAPDSIRKDWRPLLHGILVDWPALPLTLLISSLLSSRGPVQPWDWGDGEDEIPGRPGR